MTRIGFVMKGAGGVMNHAKSNDDKQNIAIRITADADVNKGTAQPLPLFL
jgi:hypothetical protein